MSAVLDTSERYLAPTSEAAAVARRSDELGTALPG